MSEIDVYKHEFCGTVAGVALYRLLEAPRPNSDLSRATTSDFLLGGGSGEHAEGIIDIISAVYSLILCDEFENDQDAGYEGPRLFNFPYSRIEALIEAWPDELGMKDADFSAWGGDAWHNFIQAAKHNSHWGKNYSQDEFGSIEYWIDLVVGEYALVNMTPLVLSLLPKHLHAEVAAFAQAISERPYMMGVVGYPTGYEHLGGRKNNLGDGNVRH